MNWRTVALLWVAGALAIFTERGFSQTVAAIPQATPEVSPAEVHELAQLHTLKDLTKRLEFRPAPERRAIYLAVAVERKVIPEAEAKEFLHALGSVEGFDRAAKLLCSISSPVVFGSRYELRLARALSDAGVPIREIRKPFTGDPAKHYTDIDLLAEFPHGHLLAIECKSGERVPTDVVNADSETLLRFVEQNPDAHAAFSFGGEPTAVAKKLLALKGIQVLSGEPQTQAKALRDGAAP